MDDDQPASVQSTHAERRATRRAKRLSLRRSRFCPATLLTTLVIGSGYALQTAWFGLHPTFRELLFLGATSNRVLAAGRYQTLLTANLLHLSWQHLTSNLVVILLVGLLLERCFGTARTSLVIVLGAVAGMLTATRFETDGIAIVGASGIALALSGAAATQIRRARAAGIVGAVIAGAELVMALTHGGRGVSNWAHVGGFAAGAIVGVAALTPLLHERRVASVRWVAAVAVLASLVLVVIELAPIAPLTREPILRTLGENRNPVPLAMVERDLVTEGGAESGDRFRDVSCRHSESKWIDRCDANTTNDGHIKLFANVYEPHLAYVYARFPTPLTVAFLVSSQSVWLGGSSFRIWAGRCASTGRSELTWSCDGARKQAPYRVAVRYTRSGKPTATIDARGTIKLLLKQGSYGPASSRCTDAQLLVGVYVCTAGRRRFTLDLVAVSAQLISDYTRVPSSDLEFRARFGNDAALALPGKAFTTISGASSKVTLARCRYDAPDFGDGRQSTCYAEFSDGARCLLAVAEKHGVVVGRSTDGPRCPQRVRGDTSTITT